MREISRCGFGLLLACSFFGASDGIFHTALHAETRTAAALTPEAVWEAIDAAKDGDTVQLPAGTAVWTKGWNTGRGAKMKAIVIQGAGMDKTIICDHRSSRGSFVPFEADGQRPQGVGNPPARPPPTPRVELAPPVGHVVRQRGWHTSTHGSPPRRGLPL